MGKDRVRGAACERYFPTPLPNFEMMAASHGQYRCVNMGNIGALKLNITPPNSA
jgi:hypothetical protein